MDTRPASLATSIGLLILRLGAGGFMASHGWGKVQMVLAGKFEEFPDPIGMGKKLSLISAAGAEFVCAMLVVIGLATRVAALPVVFTMGVAAFVVHKADPLLAGSPGPAKEGALMFLIPFLTLVFTGPGAFSFDAWLWPRFRAKKEAATPA